MKQKYYKYKYKYIKLKKYINQKGSGQIKEFTNRLYRVRDNNEKNIPDFTHPLWFVDNTFDIYWLYKYRSDQYSDEIAKNLIVDIFDITTPLNLYYFNILDYDDLQKYFVSIDKNYQEIKPENNLIDNHYFSKYLQNNYKMFNIDGWYEQGKPTKDDLFSIENMNEIMLLPNSNIKLKYIESKTIDSILSELFAD